MPLVFEKQITSAKKLAVWEITEPLDFFLENLHLERDPDRPIQRQLEQVAALYLLNFISGQTLHQVLQKDSYGKPYLENRKETVSFSHSKNLMACIFCETGSPVGIDIEYQRDNIHVLAKKFISEHDQTPYTGALHQQMVWGAKEVLYKIYGIKSLNFIEHLSVQTNNKQMIGRIRKGDYQAEYIIDACVIDRFVLVWNL